MILMITLACSCEKENVTPDDPQGITVEDLVGNWDFQSLEFNGNTTYDCDADLLADYNLVTLDLEDVTVERMTVYNECANWTSSWSSYTLSDNVINWSSGALVLEIMNVDTFDGTTLKLKLINSAAVNLPTNGVYTLTK